MAHNIKIGSWKYGISEGLEYSHFAGTNGPKLRPHSHPEAQFCAVMEGQRTFWTPHGLVFAKAGEILFMTPNTVHHAIENNDYCFVINIYAPTDSLQPMSDCAGLVKPLNTAAGLTPQNIIEQFPEFLLQMPVLVQRRLNIDRYPNPPPLGQVAALAKAAGVSREHFSRRFRRQFGSSPRTLLLENRVNFTRRLLKEGAEPCAAALDAGFSDQSHLTRHFQSFFGISPGHYQRSLDQREQITFVQA